MDILDFAMQMELDGTAFYERAAAASQRSEIRDIFLYLAEEERRHHRFFKSLKEGSDPDTAARELQSGPARTPKSIFVQLIKKNDDQTFGDDVKSVWTEALRIEEKSAKLYRDEARKEKDPKRRDLLNRIAEEERTHIYLIDNMLSFMADPQSFVESQKFAAFKSWEGH